MVIVLAPKQVVSFEKLLLAQVVQEKAITSSLVKKGIFSKEGFGEGRVRDKETNREIIQDPALFCRG